MFRPRAIYETTVGKKVIMAVTGLVLVIFLIGHVLGNLLVFAGADALNGYSALLKRDMGLLWIARSVLIVAVLLHIWSAWALTRAGHAARPVAYAKKVPQQATLASRTMRWGGVLILAFVIFHLLHFTTGTIRPVPFHEHDVFSNVVHGFQVPWVATVYIVAMIVIGFHLFHGVWAAFRTLGFTRPSQSPFRRRAALVFAVLIWAGFTAIPVAILAGAVR